MGAADATWQGCGRVDSSHLTHCSDNHLCVVKFRNNPQHPRVLANEFLATRLAEWPGLPVPVTEVVELDEWLVKRTPDLHIQLAHGLIMFYQELVSKATCDFSVASCFCTRAASQNSSFGLDLTKSCTG
jgi:hypothetical protein